MGRAYGGGRGNGSGYNKAKYWEMVRDIEKTKQSKRDEIF